MFSRSTYCGKHHCGIIEHLNKWWNRPACYCVTILQLLYFLFVIFDLELACRYLWSHYQSISCFARWCWQEKDSFSSAAHWTAVMWYYYLTVTHGEIIQKHISGFRAEGVAFFFLLFFTMNFWLCLYLLFIQFR